MGTSTPGRGFTGIGRSTGNSLNNVDGANSTNSINIANHVANSMHSVNVANRVNSVACVSGAVAAVLPS